MKDVFEALFEKAREKLGIDALLTRVSGVEEDNEGQANEIIHRYNKKMDTEVVLGLLGKLTLACEQQIAETEARLNKRIDQVLEDEQHRVHEMLAVYDSGRKGHPNGIPALAKGISTW